MKFSFYFLLWYITHAQTACSVCYVGELKPQESCKYARYSFNGKNFYNEDNHTIKRCIHTFRTHEVGDQTLFVLLPTNNSHFTGGSLRSIYSRYPWWACFSFFTIFSRYSRIPILSWVTWVSCVSI